VPRFVSGTVAEILERRDGIARCVVEVEGGRRRATAFESESGTVAVGDRVVVNTTATDLGLSTGGEDFVLWNLERSEFDRASGGHILKLRYTPWQIDTLAVEAPESPHHEALSVREGIAGLPVVSCGLHSQVPAVAAAIRSRDERLTITYVMTDGAALPIAHSDLVAEMRRVGLIDATITCGHAFGGDYEAVNVFSALSAASRVAGADVAVVAPGPGIVGTDTPFGHTGMEQGLVLSAAGALAGSPVCALRISFADRRERHRVVSHHSLSALRFATFVRSVVAVPAAGAERTESILSKLREWEIDRRHQIEVIEAAETMPALEKFGIRPTTMGRQPDQDPEFFQAAGAAGLVAAGLTGTSRDQ
jgi:hypothetical protein